MKNVRYRAQRREKLITKKIYKTNRMNNKKYYFIFKNVLESLKIIMCRNENPKNK